MAINSGVNISKFVAFGVLAPQAGIDITKFLAYAVLAPQPGVDISKFVAFAALGNPNVTPPVWGDWSFPDGTQFIAYDYGWDMPSAAETVTYSVVVGALPTGLSLTALTGNQAHVHGTPTVVNTFNFTMRATNTYGTVDKAFSITINLIPAGVGGGSFTFVC